MLRNEAIDAMRHKKTREIMQRKKVGNNTYLETRGTDIALKLHATDVVVWHEDGTITLDTGGWYTVTTRARINDYAAPFHVHSERGTWKIDARNPNYDPTRRVDWGADDYQAQAARERVENPYWSGIGAPYVDGITLDPTNAVGSLRAILDSPAAVKARELEARDAQTKKDIGKYLRGLTAERWATVLAAGSGGDCLYCRATTTGATVGDAFQNHEHLVSHLEERYYMISLAWEALKEVGYRYPEVNIQFVDTVKRALRRYLEARLLVGASGGRRGTAREVAVDGYYGARAI